MCARFIGCNWSWLWIEWGFCKWCMNWNHRFTLPAFSLNYAFSIRFCFKSIQIKLYASNWVSNAKIHIKHSEVKRNGIVWTLANLWIFSTVRQFAYGNSFGSQSNDSTKGGRRASERAQSTQINVCAHRSHSWWHIYKWAVQMNT